MNFVIEISTKPEFAKSEEAHVISTLKTSGFDSAHSASVSRLYKITGDFRQDEINLIMNELLCDRVTETCDAIQLPQLPLQKKSPVSSGKGHQREKNHQFPAAQLSSCPIPSSMALRMDQSKLTAFKDCLDSPAVSHSTFPLKGWRRVEVWLKDSVTDVPGESVKKAIADLGLKEPESVRCGTAYLLKTPASGRQIENAVKKTFVNPIVNTFSIM